MNCRTARKYIHLYKDDELTENEKNQLRKHVSECRNCKTLYEDMDIYEETIKEITGLEPYLSNPGELTDNIMSGITSRKTGLLADTIMIFRRPGLRIAASLLILFQLGVFSYQHFYVTESVRKLKSATQNESNQSGNPDFVNKECIEESVKIITDILGEDDPDFNRKAIKYSRKFSSEEIENYAVQICQYSYRLQKTSNKFQKKQLLINILNNDLNIKINPEI